MKAAPARVFLGLVIAGAVVPAWGALSKESPFLPKGGQVVAAPTENSPIEFRGVISTPGGLSFGIYEPATQKGYWVRAGEKMQTFAVQSYDAARAAVMVEYQGQVQTLVLKEAKFEGVQASMNLPPPANPAMVQARPAGGTPPQPTANPADEAKRLETVAAEVRRRRAARQAATQNAPATGVPPPPAPGR